MLDEMKAAGTHKKERVITSVQSAHITVSTSPAPVLNLCANNYLGLSSHPEVVAAAHAALDSHGFGTSSVRFICGTRAFRAAAAGLAPPPPRAPSPCTPFNTLPAPSLFPRCAPSLLWRSRRRRRGPAQGAGAQDRRLSRHGGLHPLPLVL